MADGARGVDGRSQTAAEEAEPAAEQTEARGLRFPSALTVLAIILVATWVASFFIPSGVYELDETGSPLPGSYRELPSCDDVAEGELCSDKSLGTQFGRLWRAPPNGLYGIENPATRTVGADEEGLLYGSAQIFLFVLAVGAFVTMAMRTGAIDVGIRRLAIRFGDRPMLLVVVLMTVFAVGGTTYGMWEETLGFYALMVPLVLALGYDRLVAVGIIALGAGTGTLASTVNPFATGVASDAAGIEISDGLGLRLAMWLVLVPVAIGYVIWYGNRVRADPARSLLEPVAVGSARQGNGGADAARVTSEDPARAETLALPELTGRHKVVLVIFGLTFATMIYGFIPWDDVWQNVFDTDYPFWSFSNFYLTEASMLFIVAAVIIGVVAGFGEERTASTLVSGAGEFLAAAVVIVLARGITVVMKNAFITDTILRWMEAAVENLSGRTFAALAWIVNLPIAFLVPSSSGHAALVMPILGPVSDFADTDRAITVTAYQSASGWINLITPTSAVIMGGLALAGVGYDRYLRFVAPYLALLFLVVTAFLIAGAAT
jgi:uncharacterized ion transporter superfamily protein YfcC